VNTRRNFLLALGAPAIVRATSLMQIRGLILPIERPLLIGRQYAGFCQRLMYQSLASNLRAGRMTTVLNGKIIPETDARRLVAHAQAQGWLPTRVGREMSVARLQRQSVLRRLVVNQVESWTK
jgi:hypothetical protein